MTQSEAPGVTAPTQREPRWRELLGQVRALQLELKRGNPARDFGLAGNPGAPSSAIAIAELRLGLKLPPSYRQFLAFTDGWPSFFEGAHLLGTAEIGRPSFLDLETAKHAVQPNPLLATPGFNRLVPFGADAEGKTLFAFDPNSKGDDAEMPVVAWISGLGLDCRSFTEFLATVLQLCRNESLALQTPATDLNATQTPTRGHRGPGLHTRKPLRPSWLQAG